MKTRTNRLTASFVFAAALAFLAGCGKSDRRA